MRPAPRRAPLLAITVLAGASAAANPRSEALRREGKVLRYLTRIDPSGAGRLAVRVGPVEVDRVAVFRSRL